MYFSSIFTWTPCIQVCMHVCPIIIMNIHLSIYLIAYDNRGLIRYAIKIIFKIKSHHFNDGFKDVKEYS